VIDILPTLYNPSESIDRLEDKLGMRTEAGYTFLSATAVGNGTVLILMQRQRPNTASSERGYRQARRKKGKNRRAA
jgi:hypothetical protein